MTRGIGVWLLVGLLALLLGGCADRQAPAEPFLAADVSGAGFGRDFHLFDHHGRPRTLRDFRGKVVLLSFGYTNCPDICPTTLASLAVAMERLGASAEKVQVLFATLDPARDTPALLAKYVPFFHPRFLGLYGDEAAIAATAREFRVTYQKQETGSKAGYSLDHSAGVYAFDPEGRLRLFIGYGTGADDIAHDVRLLLKQ